VTVNLTKSDVVVLCGGPNDVNKNNSNIALEHTLTFIKDNNKTNIILLSVPHRHDLMDFYGVKNEIGTFNRKLMKYIKIVEYTVFINYSKRNVLHMDCT
jgi:hypothetical protein